MSSLKQTVRRAVCTLALAALTLLGGCGFHLQGRQNLPPVLATAYIEPADSQSNFYFGLRAALRANGTQLLDAPDPKAAYIHILKDGTAERVLTVSALNVQTSYQLSYSVSVTVSIGEKELMPVEDHSVLREYSFDARTLLAKERERDVLSEALADDLVTLVMRRLSAL
jgi:LPS-assembly lipoprotein